MQGKEAFDSGLLCLKKWRSFLDKDTFALKDGH
jgi:hypothetical protein